jgi:predicted nucleic acid-binding protein
MNVVSNTSPLIALAKIDHLLIAVSTRAVLRIAEEKKIITDYHKLENSLRKRSFFLPDY